MLHVRTHSFPSRRSSDLEGLDRTFVEKASCHSEFRAVRPDGNSRYCWMETQCEFDEGGKVIALFGVCQDVTEHKQAEAELRKANELRETVIESSPLAIFTLNPHGEITLWNPAAQRIFGYRSEEHTSELQSLMRISYAVFGLKQTN